MFYFFCCCMKQWGCQSLFLFLAYIYLPSNIARRKLFLFEWFFTKDGWKVKKRFISSAVRFDPKRQRVDYEQRKVFRGEKAWTEARSTWWRLFSQWQNKEQQHRKRRISTLSWLLLFFQHVSCNTQPQQWFPNQGHFYYYVVLSMAKLPQR